jgi:hypothetical protein
MQPIAINQRVLMLAVGLPLKKLSMMMVRWMLLLDPEAVLATLAGEKIKPVRAGGMDLIRL